MRENLISRDEFNSFLEKKPKVRAFMTDLARDQDEAYQIFNGMAEGAPYPLLAKDPSWGLAAIVAVVGGAFVTSILGGGGIITLSIGVAVLAAGAIAVLSIGSALVVDVTKQSKPQRRALSFNVLEEAAKKYDKIKHDTDKKEKALARVHRKGIAHYANIM